MVRSDMIWHHPLHHHEGAPTPPAVGITHSSTMEEYPLHHHGLHTALFYNTLYLYHTMLYYTYAILYHTILCWNILYHIVLCCSILYYTILYYVILYFMILYYTAAPPCQYICFSMDVWSSCHFTHDHTQMKVQSSAMQSNKIQHYFLQFASP